MVYALASLCARRIRAWQMKKESFWLRSSARGRLSLAFTNEEERTSVCSVVSSLPITSVNAETFSHARNQVALNTFVSLCWWLLDVRTGPESRSPGARCGESSPEEWLSPTLARNLLYINLSTNSSNMLMNKKYTCIGPWVTYKDLFLCLRRG